MDIGILGLIIAVVSGLASFVLGRWLSNKRRQKKAIAAHALAQVDDDTWTGRSIFPISLPSCG